MSNIKFVNIHGVPFFAVSCLFVCLLNYNIDSFLLIYVEILYAAATELVTRSIKVMMESGCEEV